MQLLQGQRRFDFTVTFVLFCFERIVCCIISVAADIKVRACLFLHQKIGTFQIDLVSQLLSDNSSLPVNFFCTSSARSARLFTCFQSS
jgi:hypothetical protein